MSLRYIIYTVILLALLGGMLLIGRATVKVPQPATVQNIDTLTIKNNVVDQMQTFYGGREEALRHRYGSIIVTWQDSLGRVLKSKKTVIDLTDTSTIQFLTDQIVELQRQLEETVTATRPQPVTVQPVVKTRTWGLGIAGGGLTDFKGNGGLLAGVGIEIGKTEFMPLAEWKRAQLKPDRYGGIIRRRF